MTDSYREIRPHPALRPWVECFWTRRVPRGARAPDSTRVVPDGAVDILIDCLGGNAVLIGTMRRPLLVPHGQGLDLVAVRFRPGGAWPLFGFAMREITDRRPDLEATELPGAATLGDAVASAPRRRRVAVLEAFLTSRLAHLRQPDPTTREAIRSIDAGGGRAQVSGIAEQLGVGRRRLGRLFDRHVGVSPKELSRIVRLRRVLRDIDPLRRERERGEAPDPDWIDIALAAGFYDQAHLARDFRALTGTTPTGWLHR